MVGKLFTESGEVLERLWMLCPGGVQNQVEWSPEQLSLVPYLEIGGPASVRRNLILGVFSNPSHSITQA